MTLSEIVQTWFPVVTAVVAIGVAWGLFVVRTEAKQQADAAITDLRAEFEKKFAAILKEQEKLDDKVDKQDRRLITVEKGLEAFPTTRDIGKLSEQLGLISGKIEGMSAEVKGLHQGQVRQEHQMQVMNETLLSRKS